MHPEIQSLCQFHANRSPHGAARPFDSPQSVVLPTCAKISGKPTGFPDFLNTELDSVHRNSDGASAWIVSNYDMLVRRAARLLSAERFGHSLEPADLLHEAYVRILASGSQNRMSQTHFLAIISLTMRHLLVEQARARSTKKRGHSALRVALNETLAVSTEPSSEAYAINELCRRLIGLNLRMEQIVRLRREGFTVKEIACMLRISESTVKSSWKDARMWLKGHLGK